MELGQAGDTGQRPTDSAVFSTCTICMSFGMDVQTSILKIKGSIQSKALHLVLLVESEAPVLHLRHHLQVGGVRRSNGRQGEAQEEKTVYLTPTHWLTSLSHTPRTLPTLLRPPPTPFSTLPPRQSHTARFLLNPPSHTKQVLVPGSLRGPFTPAQSHASLLS